MQQSRKNSCCHIKAAHAIFRTAKEVASLNLIHEFKQFLFIEADNHDMYCSWTELTLHEDCTPSRMHLPVGPHSHSMLVPAVGF